MKPYLFLIAVAAFSLMLSPAEAKDLSKMSRDELIAAVGDAETNVKSCFESEAKTVEGLGDSIKDSAWLLVNVFCRKQTVFFDGLIDAIDIQSAGPSLSEAMNMEWINLVNAAELIAGIRSDSQ